MKAAAQLSLLGESSAEHTRRVFAVRRSKTSKKAAPAPKPWEAAVLAFDQASRVSGWALAVRGIYRDSGELVTEDREAMRAVMRRALELGKQLSLPVVLVYEGHSMRAFGAHSFAIPSYLIQAKRAVLHEWKTVATPYKHAGKHCAAPLSAWRAAVLGPHTTKLPREEVRPIELAVAQRISKRTHLGGDEAPAIGIAIYGAQSPKVGVLLGMRGRKASLEKWVGAK